MKGRQTVDRRQLVPQCQAVVPIGRTVVIRREKAGFSRRRVRSHRPHGGRQHRVRPKTVTIERGGRVPNVRTEHGQRGQSDSGLPGGAPPCPFQEPVQCQGTRHDREKHDERQ